jgi:hypothetical protein
MTGDMPVRGSGIKWGRIAFIATAFVCIYLLGRFVAEMVAQQFGFVLHVRVEPMIHTLIMTASAIYIVLMAIPFMPGVEIGFSMILVLGPKIAFLVYVCTVVALIPPYLIGRLIPARYCARAFHALGFERLGRLMDQVAPLSAEERLGFLLETAPSRITPFLLRHRFVALAVVLNIPGNMLIGGGGGIAMLAGITGLFPLPAYLLTIVLAVAPVPLIITLTDL